jgi:hypothetical protein
VKGTPPEGRIREEQNKERWKEKNMAFKRAVKMKYAGEIQWNTDIRIKQIKLKYLKINCVKKN